MYLLWMFVITCHDSLTCVQSETCCNSLLSTDTLRTTSPCKYAQQPPLAYLQRSHGVRGGLEKYEALDEGVGDGSGVCRSTGLGGANISGDIEQIVIMDYFCANI